MLKDYMLRGWNLRLKPAKSSCHMQKVEDSRLWGNNVERSSPARFTEDAPGLG